MAIQELYDKPGYQIRRLRQIAAAIFAAEAAAFGVTSQQYTTLAALGEFPQLEQGALGDAVHLDRATLAVLLARLEEKGLLTRTTAKHDKRRKHVALTARGRATLAAMQPALERIQARILAPLPPAERSAFARMLTTLVDAHARLDAHAAQLGREEAS